MREINKLIIHENETRNVGVIQHNHRIVEKETRYVKRAPVYHRAVPAYRVPRVQTVLVPVVVQPVQVAVVPDVLRIARRLRPSLCLRRRPCLRLRTRLCAAGPGSGNRARRIWLSVKRQSSAPAADLSVTLPKGNVRQGLRLVEPGGIEPPTSSLRKGMRLKSHGGSEGHDGEKGRILL